MVHYGHFQLNNFIFDPDAFYHAKMAQLIAHGTILKTLPWMQFSTIREHFTDHQLLYHVMMSPFAYFFDPLIGAKIATIVFSVASVLIFYWLLKKLNIKYPLIFALLLLTSAGLNYRLLAVKINSLSLINIWFIIYALYKKKTYLLASLGFLFVWLYGGWPLSVLIFLIYYLSQKIYQEIQKGLDKSIIKKTLACLDKSIILNKQFLALSVGLLAGIIINPYWPQNISFYRQLMQIGAINYSHTFNVGAEWHSISVVDLAGLMPHIFVAGLILFVVALFKINKLSKFSIFTILLSFVFLVLNIKSVRYLEYFIPFYILFMASTWTDLQKILPPNIFKEYFTKLNIWLKSFLMLTAALFIVLLGYSIYTNTWAIEKNTNYPLDNLRSSSLWLKNNTPEKSIIFNSDWDEWPQLFYYNDSNYYIIGLDYTLMYNYDKALHKTYDDIMLGKQKNSLGLTIKEKFGAQYILVTKKEKHSELLKNLKNSSELQNIYEDSEALIYKINL